MEQTQHGAQGSSPGPGEAARAVTDQVRDEGRRLVETARTDAMQAAEQRKSAAASYLSDLASAVHKGSEELRQKGHTSSASLVDVAADELGRLGSRMGARGVDQLWHDFEDLARRRPGLLFGAAIAVGFGAMRFAMSSRHGHPGDEYGGAPQGGYGGASQGDYGGGASQGYGAGRTPYPVSQPKKE